MVQLYQQRDFGKKINATFQYIDEHYQSLGLAFLTIWGPLALAISLASRVVHIGIAHYTSFSTLALFTIGSSSVSFWVLLFLSMLNNLLVVMIINAHLLSYEENPDEPITVSRLWPRIEADFFRVLPVALASWVLFVAGCLLLLLPGIYIGITLVMAVFVAMRETGTAGQVIQRCFALIRHHWWETFGVLLIMGLVQVSLTTGMTLPITVVIKVSRLTNPIILTLIETGQLLLQSLLQIPFYIAVALNYFSLLDEKEGISLWKSIEAIGSPTAVPGTLDDHL